MENILQDIPGVAVYLDDIILTGATKAKHIEMLDLVLGRLEEAGLRLKRKKCTFLADEVVYLGHKIDQHGLHPIEGHPESEGSGECARTPGILRSTELLR